MADNKVLNKSYSNEEIGCYTVASFWFKTKWWSSEGALPPVLYPVVSGCAWDYLPTHPIIF